MFKNYQSIVWCILIQPIFFLTIGDHIIGFPLYTYMHGHSMFSYTVLNWRWLITCSFMICVQKERRTLLAKRLDLDACKTKVRKAQSPEKIQQVKTVYLDSRQSLFCSKICLREYLSIWVARAWIEKVQILRLYLHFLNSRRRNSHDFAAWILLLTDFWAKERLLAVYGVLYITLTTRRWPKLLSPSRLHEHQHMLDTVIFITYNSQ